MEKWLLEVEAAMFQSVHHVTALGIEDYSTKPRNEWVLEWPGMVVLVCTALFWTQGVEKAIQDKSTDAYAEQCTQDLLKIVDLVRGTLTKLQRATLGNQKIQRALKYLLKIFSSLKTICRKFSLRHILNHL